MKKNMSWRKLCSILLSIAVLLYLFYQIYSISSDTIQTEFASDYTYHQAMTIDAFIVRQESPLTNDKSGVIGYAQGNGSKVPAGQVVARVFDSDEQAALQTQLDAVNELIDDLSSLQKENMQLYVNVEMLDNRINQAINQYLSIIDRCQYQGSETASKELVRLLNKKQLTLGSSANIGEYLSILEGQKSELEAGIKNSTVITTDKAGYFVNHVDGCETVIDYQKIKETTIDTIENALDQTPEKSGLGKIVIGNEWYLTAVISQEKSQQFSLGSDVTITIPILSSQEYKCSVEALNIDYSSDTVALVLKCSQVNAEVLGVRKVKAQVRMNTYKGLKISNKSLRKVDGITGVYIVDGISAKFMPVEILYSDTDMVICKYNTINNNNLKIYDEVIVEGRGMYDGKIIR